MAYSTNPDKDCYCSLWDTHPDQMRKEGIPEGYCGFCSAIVKGKKCGKPGHVRSSRSGPFSFCSCDEHYSEDSFNPISFGCNLAILLGILGGIILLVRWLFF